MKLELIAQLAVAGGLVGLLIGPDSLDQFIGMFPNNTVTMNVLVGTLIGAVLGVLGSFAKEDR